MDRDPNGWMLTYSDMTTLLLTFFVMIMAMSSFDTNKIRAFISGNSIMGRGGLGVFRKGGSGTVKFISRKEIIKKLREGSPYAILSRISKEFEVKETSSSWLISIPIKKAFSKDGSILPSFMETLGNISKMVKKFRVSQCTIMLKYPSVARLSPDSMVLSVFHVLADRFGVPPEKMVVEICPSKEKGELVFEFKKRTIFGG